MRTTTRRELPILRRINWWMIGFFVALLAFEIAREMVVLEAADRPALTGGEQFFNSNGLTIAEGSWLRTDEGDALVRSSVHIECDQSREECLEATVNVDGNSVSLPFVERFAAQFSPDFITYENNNPVCVRYTTMIDLRLKKVRAVRQKNASKEELCKTLEDRVEMQLVNGSDVSVDPFEGHFVPIIQVLFAILKLF